VSLDQSQIYEWKSKYGKVMRLNLEGSDVYFRTLTCREIQYVKTLEESAIKIVPDLVILNDIKLKQVGSKHKITQLAISKSNIDDEDKLKETALENRLEIKQDFTLSLIQKICSVFVSYTPDTLMDKNIWQLMKLVALAEEVSGNNIINTGGEKPKSNLPPTFVNPTIRDGEKWAKVDEQGLMEDSVDELNKALGKNIPTIKDKKLSNLTDLQKQMKTLDKFVK